jgi:hypothetical protein
VRRYGRLNEAILFQDVGLGIDREDDDDYEL